MSKLVQGPATRDPGKILFDIEDDIRALSDYIGFLELFARSVDMDTCGIGAADGLHRVVISMGSHVTAIRDRYHEAFHNRVGASA